MDKRSKWKKALACAALVASGAIWGGGVVVMKGALDHIPVNCMMALRFTVGALATGVFLFRGRSRIGGGLIWRGALLGVAQYAAFAMGTYGLLYTTAGKNSMLMGTYVIIVPFFVWMVRKVRPKLKVLLAAALCVGGIILLCMGGAPGAEAAGFNLGDLLSCGSSVAFAMALTLSNIFFEKHDVMQLTCIQFSTTAVISWAATLLFETFPRAFTPDMWGAMAYICLAGTVVAMTLQNMGLKQTDSALGALLLSTESPFGVILAAIFLKEVLNGRMVIGCLLIVAAIVLAQVEPERLRGRLRKKPPAAEAETAEGGEIQHGEDAGGI